MTMESLYKLYKFLLENKLWKMTQGPKIVCPSNRNFLTTCLSASNRRDNVTWYYELPLVIINYTYLIMRENDATTDRRHLHSHPHHVAVIRAWFRIVEARDKSKRAYFINCKLNNIPMQGILQKLKKFYNFFLAFCNFVLKIHQ